jgi:DNA repair protein RadA/Sms
LGELGLSGEIRSIPNLEKRIEEATRLGFKKIIVPRQLGKKIVSKVELIEARTIKEAINII